LIINVYGLELWSDRQWLHRCTLPKADVVVSDCHFSANFVLSHYGARAERLHIIWDCVDTKRFHPKPRRDDLLHTFGVPVGPQYSYVMILGRMDKWSYYKGYDRLLDVMLKLNDYPHIIALFAGDGDDRHRLEQRVWIQGLAGRVFFLGNISEVLLVDVYNLCDVFALVSDRGYGHGEGIPLTPLEAAACGKPIIVGNEDGSQEAVAEGVNGHIVSPRDPHALRQALLDIITNPDLREKMGQAARARIEAEFSYEGFREKTARILGELQYKISERDTI
jgi:phosphatidylinositol alpha-1,6-mannosyltransferase